MAHNADRVTYKAYNIIVVVVVNVAYSMICSTMTPFSLTQLT